MYAIRSYYASTTTFSGIISLEFISIVAQYGTLSITEIVAAQQGGWQNWVAFTNPFAMIAGMLAFLGMSMQNHFRNNFV